MSQPQPPTRGPTRDETKRYATAMHNVAIATLIICPVLALLPPRKFDTYTIGLVGLTGFSANQLYRESHGGKSIWQRLESPLAMSQSAIPTERGRELQRQLKEQREAQLRQAGKTEEDIKRASQNAVEKIWMGKETQGWSEKREKEVQEAMAEGKGYGDIIMDQIWEVWTWGKTTDEDDANDSK